MDVQVHEGQNSPNRINAKKITPSHVIIKKYQKSRTKRILKASGEK